MNGGRRWYDALEPRPWSANQLRKLGRAISQGDTATEAVSYSELVDWHNSLIFAALVSVRDAVQYELGPEGIRFSLGSRAKTLETVRDKLIRDKHRPLGNMQDLAGIRITANMALGTQAAVAERIARDLRQRSSAVESRLDGSHAGYRALHVVCTFKELGGAKLEVQVRTTLQNAWANLYDALADRYGREIRYGAMPTDAAAKSHVSRVKGVTSLQVRELEEAREELSTLERGIRRLGFADLELAERVEALRLQIDARAALLQRTMESEETQIRMQSQEGDPR